MGRRMSWTLAWIFAATAAARGQAQDVLAEPIHIPYVRPARWDVAPLRHNAFISAAGWADGDRRILSLDGEGLVICWDSSSGHPRYALRAPDGKYLCLSTRGDDTTMALGRSDGVVELRDARNGRLLRTAPAEEDVVIAVSWAPKASVVAVALANGKIRRFKFGDSVQREDVAHTIGQFRSLDVAPDGERIAHVSDLVVLWVRTEPERWKRVPIVTEKFVPGGQRAVFCASGERLAVSYYRDHSRVHDGTSGKLLQTSSLGASKAVTSARSSDRLAWMDADGAIRIQEADGHSDLFERINQETPLELSSDGTRLIASLSEKQLQVFDLEAKARILPGREVVPAVTHLAWSRDGSRLFAAHGDGVVRQMDATRKFEVVETKNLNGDILDLRVAGDGRRMALVYQPGYVAIRDLATDTDVVRRKVEIVPRGGSLSADLTMAVWEKNWLEFEVVRIPGGDLLPAIKIPADVSMGRHPSAHMRVKIAPGNRYVLLSIPQEFVVWDVRSGEAVARRTRHWNDSEIAISSDGLRICLVETAYNEAFFLFQSAPWPAQIGTFRWKVYSDSTRLLFGNASQVAILWHSAGWHLVDPFNGLVHRRFDAEELTEASLSPGDRLLATGSRRGRVTICAVPCTTPWRRTTRRPETLIGDLAGSDIHRSLASCRELASLGDTPSRLCANCWPSDLRKTGWRAS